MPPNGSMCSGGCEYILAPQSGNPDIPGGVINEGNGVYSGTAVGTGAACTPDNAPPKTNDQCVIDDLGNSICFSQSPDCSIYNGNEYCIHDVPQGGGCVYNEKGFICTQGSTPPPNTEGVTPTKEGTMHGDSNGDGTVESGDVYNITDNSTTNNSSGGGGCGGPGQAPCKIDESGTPDANNDTFNGTFETWDPLSAESDTFEVSMLDDIKPQPLNLPYGSCVSHQYTWAGHTFEFPGTRGCTYLENFKTLLYWMIWLFTFYFVFDIVLSMRPK